MEKKENLPNIENYGDARNVTIVENSFRGIAEGIKDSFKFLSNQPRSIINKEDSLHHILCRYLDPGSINFYLDKIKFSNDLLERRYYARALDRSTLINRFLFDENTPGLGEFFGEESNESLANLIRLNLGDIGSPINDLDGNLMKAFELQKVDSYEDYNLLHEGIDYYSLRNPKYVAHWNISNDLISEVNELIERKKEYIRSFLEKNRQIIRSLIDLINQGDNKELKKAVEENEACKGKGTSFHSIGIMLVNSAFNETLGISYSGEEVVVYRYIVTIIRLKLGYDSLVSLLNKKKYDLKDLALVRDGLDGIIFLPKGLSSNYDKIISIVAGLPPSIEKINEIVSLAKDLYKRLDEEKKGLKD